MVKVFVLPEMKEDDYSIKLKTEKTKMNVLKPA